MQNTTSPLELARSLDPPGRDATLRRDASVHAFWSANRRLLADAWVDWDATRATDPVVLDESLLDPRLRNAVTNAWVDPTTESSVMELLDEVAPDVYAFQFFDPERIAALRDYLEQVWDAGIPLRPPYGIVLNRGGAMLDVRSDGALAAPTFQTFYRMVMDRYMRPIARLLFHDIVGHDAQTFGFSIHYQPTTDTSIRPHTDASTVTLNVNANLPGETFTGSTVDFFDSASGEVHALTFDIGTAMIHRGNVPHTAQPITSGKRTNLVFWLMGDNPTPLQQFEDRTVSAHDRWTIPTAAQTSWAPF
ncbi:MAG: 2OG-Fe(II) oxygenase family protein [Actinomycetota bacterium]